MLSVATTFVITYSCAVSSPPEVRTIDETIDETIDDVDGVGRRVQRESHEVAVGRAVHLNVLLLADRSLDSLTEICHRHGITHQQYVALWTLCLADDPDGCIPIGAIADGLLNRASDVTRLVDRLARSDLAERLPNPTDRRSVLVRVTAQGRGVFDAVTPELQAFHARQWSKLSADEIETLNSLLAKAMWGTDD
jgi:DNA-binding MarR family transcriptional regulator